MPVRSTASSSPARAVHRLRLAAICVGLALLTFSQSSGYEAADTKLDLVVSPLRFLRNSLQMWDPLAAAGQMQDQAYGYLFPMGPFFVLGKTASLSPWVVQRSWESLLLIAAFLGTVRLARLLRVPGAWPRVAAGLAYALAPRMLMEIGVISSELLPVVALPWVMVPLVRGAHGGSPRRAGARSGVALLFAGGINASATLAILPVPLLYLLSRRRGPRRRALLGWWAGATVLSCLWWALPLLVLGKYSPPFLDWIESSAVTTGHTDLLEVLRGADHWQAYLGPSVWPAGWVFVAASGVVLATSMVAVLGLAGVVRTRTPERTFLISTLVLGAVLLTLGHVAEVGPPFAGSVRTLLDGPLNAFRNMHKFDPLVRLPLAIGVGHGAAALASKVRTRPWLPVLRGGVVPARPLVVAVLVGLAVVAIAPALTGRLVPDTRTSNDPSWWSQTGTWLGKHAAGGRALVVPGAGAPVYLWGSPRDDALQPVADAPWTVRDVAPLTQPGYVRLLDAIEADLSAGQGDSTLPTVLARAGIRYLVVRNDLDTQRSGATPLRYVHAAIDATPGLAQVAQFGADLTGGDDPHRLVDLGLTRSRGAVDVYANAAWTGRAEVVPAAGAVAANGSADEVPALTAAGLPAGTPVLFGAAAVVAQRAGVPTTPVLTDGIRRREVGFGGIGRYSPTLTADSGYSAARAAHDYLPADAGVESTVAYTGISGVTASSSASDPTSPLYVGPQDAPWAALDASSATAWRSATFAGAVGQWLQVQFPHAVDTSTAQIAFAGADQPFPSRVRVTTDQGSQAEDVSPDAIAQPLQLPPGATQTLRITVLDTTGGGAGDQVGIASLTVPGVQPARVMNVVGPTDPAALVFRVTAGDRSPCLSLANGVAACDNAWAQPGEEDVDLSRGFTVSRAATYVPSAAVVLRPGAQLDQLLDAGNPITATASSTDSSDPRERPGAAVDADGRTAWVAAQGDRSPTLTLRMSAARTLTGVTLQPLADGPVTRPQTISVRAGTLRLSARVPADGRVTFPTAVRTDRVSITVTKASLAASTDSLTGQAHLLPVGLAEVRLLGADVPAGHVSPTVQVGCAAGVQLGVDGKGVPLQVDAPVAQVLAGEPVTATACGGQTVSFGPGRHEVALGRTTLTAPQAVTLLRNGTPFATAVPGSADAAAIGTWGRTTRTLRVTAVETSFLVVHENANAGWRATLHGHPLTAVTIDGWQQGWILPAGANGTVTLEFTPQHIVDVGLLVGLLAALALLGLALVRPRRRVALPPAVAGRPGRTTTVVVCLVAAGALGGAVGVLMAAAVLVTRFRWARRGHRLPVLAGPVLLLVVGLLGAWRPAGSTDPLAGSVAAQIGCLLALTLALVTLDAAPPPAGAPQDRLFQDVPGQRGDDGGARGGQQP